MCGACARGRVFFDADVVTVVVTVADDGAPLVAPVGASAGFELRHPMAQSGQMRNQFQTNVRAKDAFRALERAARGETATVE